jgi:cyclopropane fatty-acyl-phospholipid synthase-like methyltransferase
MPFFPTLLVYSIKPLRKILHKKYIPPRERTKLLYTLLNKWCDKLCGISCWAECSTDEFEKPKEQYQKKYNEILDLLNCNTNSELLEIGPGTGELLKNATNITKNAVGLELCPENVNTCKQKGLKVIQGDASKDLDIFPENKFDIVIANSSMEHAVTEEDFLAGRADDIYQKLFKDIYRILKPNGKLYISLIHHRTPVNASDMIKDPFEFPVLSKKFHLALLSQVFSGSYPYVGQLDGITKNIGFKKTYEYDGTPEYLASCKNWPVQKSIFNPVMLFRFFLDRELRSIFLNYRYYIYLNIVKLLSYSWTWQFLPSKEENGLTPTVYLCQIYEKK